MKQVLFVCLANAGRSQMAEAFFNNYAQGQARAASAGMQPGATLNPGVVAAMAEVGIDISQQRPKLLTPEMLEQADRVITMGCDVPGVCPAPVDAVAWDLEAPVGKPIEEIRRIRDEVEARVLQLLEELQSAQSPLRK